MRIFTTLILCLAATCLFSQTPVFKGQPHKTGNQAALSESFKAWQTFDFDMAAFDEFVKEGSGEMEFNLQFNDLDWQISLWAHDLRSPDYVKTVLTVDGEKNLPADENLTFRGIEQGAEGQVVALTVDENLLYGLVRQGDETWFIEPLWYFLPDAPKNRVVIYAASEVIPKEGNVCGYIEMKKQADKHLPSAHDFNHGASEKSLPGNCFTVQLAQAADLLMTAKFGSAAAVNAHMTGVMNNVQTNYDNEFADNLEFSIVQQFVVVPPATDPWTNSTNAGALLNSFTNWGPNGFSSVHDIGQLWTNRDFDGSTIGIAWVGAVCTSDRYHCLQDFTTNAGLLRCMTSHEIGHNFDANHDPSGSNTIMAPSVSNTNTWSSASVNAINAYVLQIDPPGGCLSFCPTSALPPIANFSASPANGCAPHNVQYTDQTANAPTGWNWTFPGGTPSSSTAQNPLVTYNSPGTYGTTLIASNGAGSNTFSQTNLITVSAQATSSFSYSQLGLTVVFTNTSTNATGYLWDFGDGSTSTQANPIHTYTSDNFFNVTLTATNACGPISFSNVIPVFTPPTANFSGTPTSGCAALTVNFSNLSSPNVTNWSWNFPGGSPSASSAQNPTVIYTGPGTYSVTLIVSNPAGAHTITQTNYITASSVPIPAFTSTVNGNTATFSNTSTGATSYSWNFGDGGTSTQQNPTHTYASNGTYSVTLTATNACGPSTVVHSVSIVTPPTANFSAAPTTGCAPLSVVFTNLSSANSTTFNWIFQGGSPATSIQQNPTVAYNSPGTYDVTLIVVNSAGSDTTFFNDYVIVGTTATASFTSSVSGTTASFSNTSTNATSYSWNFGDGGTSTQTNPSHTYPSNGTYTVTLSATNNCGTVTTTQTVTIVTPPTASFSANMTNGCAPLTVQFTSTSSANATTFNWQFPGGSPASSTAQNPSVNYSSPGTYNVTLTSSNSAGSNTSTQTNFVTVGTTPSAGFTSSGSGTTASFSNTSTNATSYSWNFGDGGTSAQTSPSHTYAGDGTYTVTLNATNACGTVTTTQTVTIVTPPTANFTANGTSGCAPMTVQFTSTSSANATNFNWQFPGGSPASSTAQNPTVTYSTAGIFNVSLTVSNAAGSNTASQSNFVNVGTVPSPGFSASTNVFAATFNNLTANGTSYSWNFGEGGTSNSANPTYTYPGDGTYMVVLTASNGCGTSIVTQQVVITSLPQAGFSANAVSGCSPMTVQFQNQSSSNTTNWQWSFPGGSPASSTAQNPMVTYATPGSYNVSLTASNGQGGNTSSQANFINVGTTPTAGFTSGVSGTIASFSNTSTNATSYSWNFGDNGTSTESSPSHTYAADGTYTVTLNATNACGTVTTTQTVTIVTPPTANFTANVTSGCAPLTVQFSSTSSANATSFNWTFPGGTPGSSTAENPTVVYSAAGVYNASLTVGNAAGSNTASQTNFITVNTVPTAGFMSGVNGTNTSFSNTSVNAVSYSWNFGDSGTSTEANPSHSYASDGVFSVTLTATNACGSVTATQTVTIVTPPTAAFSAAQTLGCEPFTVQFENESSSNATTFDWSFPGGTPSSSNEENPTVIYSAPGTYDVELTVSNPAGNNSTTQTSFVTVNPAPTPGFTFSVLGSTADFTNNSANATTFEWDFGDSNTSTEENPSHTYTADGAYTVTLTAKNDCGSVSTTELVVIATQGPIAAFTAENTTGCAPLVVTFENLSSDNATTFQWSFPGGNPATSTAENPVVTYNSPGTFDVTLIASDGTQQNTSSQTAYISVNTVPTPGFTFNANQGEVIFTNASSNAASFGWNFGDGSTSTEESPTYTYSSSGEYEVTLTAFNECGFSSNSQTVLVVITGTNDLPGISTFEVFPNPNDGRFSVSLQGDSPLANDLEISFTNVLGQRLLSEAVDFRSGEWKREFSFGYLPAGMYVFMVKSGEKFMFRKVVVE